MRILSLKKAIRLLSRLRPWDSCKDKLIELQIDRTVVLHTVFETISYVIYDNLIQAHQHSRFTINRTVNPSNRFKLFESKPSYAGFNFFQSYHLTSGILGMAKNFKGL
jgi:hypothetical protein